MLDFIFYNDRLLLKKDEEGHCHVPDETELPERWAQLTPHHEVLLPNGHMIRTAATDRPVDEDSRWTMTGLRASFDHVSLAEYKAAGKAFQILWWDRHSRFCPVCGTRTEQRAPIMKRCPACGYEIYPPISTAWYMRAISAARSTAWWRDSSSRARHWSSAWNAKYAKRLASASATYATSTANPGPTPAD